MKKTKLKPCPFCGSDAKLVENYRGQVRIECTNLACRASHNGWFDDPYGDARYAVNAWNERNVKCSEKPNGSLINRQDAIKPFCIAPDGTRIPEVDCDNFPVEFSVEFIKKHLLSLPSADAVEVVRCKDCKWHLNGHLCKQLSQYGSIETPPSFYCGFGERREP